MKTYETKHSIGDLVYISDKYDVDREVIKAVKIIGTKETIKYGIKRQKGGDYFSLFWHSSDDFNWYSTGEVFLDKESAVAHHEHLKAASEAKQLEEDQKQKAERKAELLGELKELDN